jgi:hypothetical protein
MTKHMQPSFVGGELAPALWGRVDLQKYDHGARVLKNFIVHPHGGISNRPGTYYLADAALHAKKSRLVPFEFSTEQTYAIEFGDKTIRFFSNGGQVVSGTTPYAITSPYEEADLDGLSFTQSADTLYICHPELPTMKLLRSAHTSWALQAVSITGGPFMPENDTDVTIQAENESGFVAPGEDPPPGDVKLTVSSALFQAGHVGSLWKITRWNDYRVVDSTSTTLNAKGWGTVDLGIVKGQWRFETFGLWDGTIEIQTSYDEETWTLLRKFKSTLEVFAPDWETRGARNFDATGVEEEDEVHYRLVAAHREIEVEEGVDPEPTRVDWTFTVERNRQDGVVKITSVTSGTEAYGDRETDMDWNVDATKFWAEGAWSAVRGYPSCAVFFQDRLVFGASLDEPQTIWMSKIGSYEDFGTSRPVTDEDAVTFTIASRQVNGIRSLVPLSDLLVMTSGGEWRVAAGDQAITASTLSVRVQGYRGVSELPPIVVGNILLFVQEKGATIRDFGYSLESDGYDGADRSVLAAHLFEGHTIVSWAYQQNPDSVVWCCRDDGVLLGFTYMREHDVWAWSRHETDGAFESVCAISGSGRDDVYFVVRRTIGGATKRFVEQLMPRTASPVEDAFFVDCGLSYEGAPASTLSGLAHLNGKTVAILADGNVHAPRTVTGGAVTLDFPASKAHVGLPYVSDLETLNLDMEMQDGSIHGRKKRISTLTLRVDSSRGAWAGSDASKLMELKMRGEENLGEPIRAFTGDKKLVMKAGWDEGGRILIRQPDPLPLTVLAIIPEVSVGG